MIRRLTLFSIFTLFFCFTVSYGQDEFTPRYKSDLTEEYYNSWAVGGGFSNFIMHGDLRSIGTGIQGNYFNFGGYLYGSKMFNPIVGVEFKLNYNSIKGGAQYLSDVYDILYINNARITDNLFFEGTAFGGEINAFVSISNLFRRKQRKFNVLTYLGLGYHQYDSQLFETTDTGGRNLLVDFGVNPARNNEKNASSIYFTQQLALRYRINKKFDVEFRAGWYLNYEDHLDATISNKQDLEIFFQNHIGVVYKIGQKDSHFLWSVQKDGGKIVIEKPKDDLLDTDKDGVPDRFDVEPGTPIGVMVYGNGKAIDSDKDGLPDHKDKCVLEPGPIENKGCPVLKDTDGDGIFDYQDLCPLEKGPEANKGCPVPKKEPESVTIIRYISELAANVYFDTAKWSIKPESIEVLDKIANYMDKVPDINFKIEGHTDNRATDRYNLFLSQKRADAVFKYLLRKGIKRGRLSFRGYGETRPKFSNETPEGRQLNRRVEIKPEESFDNTEDPAKKGDEKKGDEKKGEEKKEGGDEKKGEEKKEGGNDKKEGGN